MCEVRLTQHQSCYRRAEHLNSHPGNNGSLAQNTIRQHYDDHCSIKTYNIVLSGSQAEIQEPTRSVNIFSKVEGGGIGSQRGIERRAVAEAFQRRAVGKRWPADALLPQVPHEELEANEGENGQRKHRQDHHVHHLLHRLDQSSHNGLQTWEPSRGGQIPEVEPPPTGASKEFCYLLLELATFVFPK